MREKLNIWNVKTSDIKPLHYWCYWRGIQNKLNLSNYQKKKKTTKNLKETFLSQQRPMSSDQIGKLRTRQS